MGEKGGTLGTTPRTLLRYLLQEPPNMTQLSSESLRDRCCLLVSKNFLLCYLLFIQKRKQTLDNRKADRQNLHHVIRASITTMCDTGVTPLPWIWHLTPLSHEKTTDRHKWRQTRRRVNSYLFHSVQLSTQSESKVWMSDLTLCNGSMETGNTLRHQEW